MKKGENNVNESKIENNIDENNKIIENTENKPNETLPQISEILSEKKEKLKPKKIL